MTDKPDAAENNRSDSLSWRRQVLAVAFIAAAVSLLTAAAFHKVPILIKSENWTRDWRMTALKDRPAEIRPDIVVLGLDEVTFDSLTYRSPVDRGFLAELLNYLAELDVRAVGIDILISRPTEPEKDRAFFAALNRFPAPLVVVWADPDEAEAVLTEKEKAYMVRNLANVRKGYANVIQNSLDGVVRTVNVHHRSGKDGHPGFAAAIAAALNYPLPDTDIALDYAPWPEGESSPFATHSAINFKRFPKSFFASVVKNKIVLIGGMRLDVDRKPTPFDAANLGDTAAGTPGVVVHAHALAQLIDGRRVNIARRGTELLIVAIAAVAGAATALLSIPVWLMLLAGASLLMVFVTVLSAAYPVLGTMLPVFPPSLAFLAALMVMSFYQQRRFHEERAFIRGALSRYVAEDMVRQLEREPWRLKLGGERRNLTFLFTDIADFTTLSERTEPVVLVAALNQYLDGASRVVLEHGGTIDKYIGDAIVAVFSPFDERDTHASSAVECALALDRFAENFAAEQRESGLDFGVTRIGVNSGSAIIGNFGGDLRFDYTSIGDAVNTAARLEGANKYFGTRLCVSGSAFEACADIPARPIGQVVLKGKSDAIPVFQPIDGTPDARLAPADSYAAAYAQLAASDPGAVNAFKALAAQYPEDGLVAFHVNRLAAGETGDRIAMEEK